MEIAHEQLEQWGFSGSVITAAIWFGYFLNSSWREAILHESYVIVKAFVSLGTPLLHSVLAIT